jgi:hypothetical protein
MQLFPCMEGPMTAVPNSRWHSFFRSRFAWLEGYVQQLGLTHRILGPGKASMRSFRSARRVQRSTQSLVIESLECRALPSFVAPLAFDAGTGPISVAVGDFNGDGKPDLAVANHTRNDESVLLGNGDGSFQAPRSISTGFNPFSVVVGDFRGDGHQDLAVANSTSNTVSVLLGNGDGSFQGPRNVSVGNEPVSLAVGDFNGDGHQDVVVGAVISERKGRRTTVAHAAVVTPVLGLSWPGGTSVAEYRRNIGVRSIPFRKKLVIKSVSDQTKRGQIGFFLGQQTDLTPFS